MNEKIEKTLFIGISDFLNRIVPYSKEHNECFQNLNELEKSEIGSLYNEIVEGIINIRNHDLNLDEIKDELSLDAYNLLNDYFKDYPFREEEFQHQLECQKLLDDVKKLINQ